MSLSYEEALSYLAGFVDLERGGMQAGALGLERTRELLAALGDPQERYPSVLIAGTNGKGSTAAMVERGLRAAGYRTGLYTQPHLHTIRERVRVDGEPIRPDAFGEAMALVAEAVEPLSQGCGPASAYEVMTALALDHFARAGLEVAVIEVGLGGRLDATNVVNATVSAITSIGLDHTQVLGKTLAAIAAEKADIIKPGRQCVSAPLPPEAAEVVRNVAEGRKARLYTAGFDGALWDAPPRDGDLLISQGRIQKLQPALVGRFQRTNAAVAATVLEAMRAAGLARVSLRAIRESIERVEWPGRFEVMAGAPPTVIDGAHNVDAALALREALREQFEDRPVVLVLGIGADKDARGIIGALRPARLVVATRSRHPRAEQPARIAGLASAAGLDVAEAPTVAAALDAARERAAPTDVVVVAGSLYVVAEAREALSLAEPAAEPAYDPWARR